MRRKHVLAGHKILRGRLVLKTKRDRNGNILKYKARWVVKGFEQQYSKDYDQTFVGVYKSATQKLVIALIAFFDLEVEQIDAVQAFLNSQPDVDIYIELPPNWETIDLSIAKDTPEQVYLLLRALYRLKQAPRLWQKKLASVLKQLGFEPCLSNYCVYYNKETGILIVTYVDDMLIVGKS